VQHYAELEEGGTFLVLCHYPLRSWHRMSRGALNLHGHSHGRLAPLPRQVDVGVDVWNFRPITLADIRAHLRRRGRIRL
jgi:calcineurin-like phosphoesterase family protein